MMRHLLIPVALLLLAKCLPWPLALPLCALATFCLFRWLGLYGEPNPMIWFQYVQWGGAYCGFKFNLQKYRYNFPTGTVIQNGRECEHGITHLLSLFGFGIAIYDRSHGGKGYKLSRWYGGAQKGIAIGFFRFIPDADLLRRADRRPH